MANVKLSAAEIELVNNAQIILTKNSIITKVYDLFGALSHFYVDEMNKQSALPKELLAIAPKISRGENYEGLPWVMLDYPRYFTKTNELAIRTYFWWGNFCSITLQMSGEFQQEFQSSIHAFRYSSHVEGWFLCCAEDKWQHHFRSSNYKLLPEFTHKEIQQLSFIKLAKKIPLNQWNDIEIFMQNSFLTILDILK